MKTQDEAADLIGGLHYVNGQDNDKYSCKNNGK